MTIPFDAKKGFSREFLAYFAETLNDVATKGLDDLMDFLADENATDFALEWDAESFENGKAELKETEYFAYPRYWGNSWNIIVSKAFEIMRSSYIFDNFTK